MCDGKNNRNRYEEEKLNPGHLQVNIGLHVGQNVTIYSKDIIVISLNSFIDGSYGFV